MTVAWVTCEVCGAELRDSFRFCDTWGCPPVTSTKQAAECTRAVDVERVRAAMIELVRRSAVQ